MKFVRVLLFLSALYVQDKSVSAGGFSNPDFGIRRLGMFAVVAKPDDPTAVFHNPAGLTLLDGTVFYHHQSWFINQSAMRLYDSKGNLRPDHDISPDIAMGFIPFLGLVSDLSSKKLHFGIAVYAPNIYGAALPKNEPTRYHVTRAIFIAGRITFAGAYKIDERFSIGVSFSVVPVYLWARRAFNLAVFQDPDKRFDPVENTSAYDSWLDVTGRDITWAMDFGVLLRPFPRLYIGGAIQGGSPVHLTGDVTLKNPDGSEERTRHHTEIVIPLTLRAGFNWEFVKDFELAMDIFWWHYSVLQEQKTIFEKPLKGMNGLTEPKNYTNSWSWNIGLLYRISPKLEIMMGFQKDFTPIPTKTITLDNPSRSQMGIAGGLRWQCHKNVKIGFAVVRNWFEPVDVQDSVMNPPSNAKGYGKNLELGFDVNWRLW